MAYIYIYTLHFRLLTKRCILGKVALITPATTARGYSEFCCVHFPMSGFTVNHSDLPDVTSQCAAVWTVEALHMHITRVYIYVCAGKRLWVQNLTWLWMNVQVLGQKHTCMHVCMLTHTHACTHAHTHARTHAPSDINRPTHKLRFKQTHTLKHTCMQTYTHKLRHKHTNS